MTKFSKILKSKKGFTLMEVIVVLIILAVLAAALIPTFLGFIRQAGHATAIAEARLGMTAAQAVVTESVGRNAPIAETAIPANPTFVSIIEADLGTGAATLFSNVVVVNNRVIGIIYNQGTGGFTVTISQEHGAVVEPGTGAGIPSPAPPTSPDPENP